MCAALGSYWGRGLVLAPKKAYMADVQSIMYVHVPTAWNADLCLRLLLRRVVELAAPDAVDAADGLLGGDPLPNFLGISNQRLEGADASGPAFSPVATSLRLPPRAEGRRFLRDLRLWTVPAGELRRA